MSIQTVQGLVRLLGCGAVLAQNLLTYSWNTFKPGSIVVALDEEVYKYEYEHNDVCTKLLLYASGGFRFFFLFKESQFNQILMKSFNKMCFFFLIFIIRTKHNNKLDYILPSWVLFRDSAFSLFD
jgi:hypothetical protein